MDRPIPRAWARDFEQWMPRFMDGVKTVAKARIVWLSLRDRCIARDRPLEAGLVYHAALLLFIASKPEHLELDRQYEQAQKLVALIKRAEGAKSEASRSPQGSRRGRPQLQAEEAMRELLSAPWIEVAPGVRTVRDALEFLRREIGRDVSLTELHKLIVQTAGQKQSPFSALYPLAMLQELALEYGLRLGYKKIATLCCCAGFNVNKRTLARYFASLDPDDRDTVRESLRKIREGRVRRDKYPALFARLRRN